MIIITRKIAEKVCIGNDIEVTVLDVIDRSVRLGLHAPLDMVVRREETPSAIEPSNVSYFYSADKDKETPENG